MPRNSNPEKEKKKKKRPGGSGSSSKRDDKRGGRVKPCIFCKEKIDWIDYKDADLLRRYISDRGKIRARRVSGNCTQHQRDVAVAIKTARELALIPYSLRLVTARSSGRFNRNEEDSDQAMDEAAVPAAVAVAAEEVAAE